jgi:hypothetical protein
MSTSVRALVTFTSVLAAIAACGGSTSTSDGGADGSTDGSKNPCDGLGCAIGVGKLTVHVLDAQSMTPVLQTTFTENGQPLMATCVASDAGVAEGGADGGAPLCSTWLLQTVFIGAHTIGVHAPGYKDETLTVTMQGPSGCCGMGPDVDKTVLLTSSAPAALCVATGGTVTMGSCCQGTSDFPDLCTTGPCGCGPQSSHMVQICSCSGTKCFKPGVGCQ